MGATLEQLVEDGIVDEVLARLKSGKEADVWLVRHGDKTLAAKIYKDRAFRSFKNDAGYKEGRTVRNSRTQRAMDRGSKFGQSAAEEAWKSAESDALHKLHAAGVRVPEPVLFYDGVLVMNLALDAEGNVAPRLIDALIEPAQAAALYADLRSQAVKMLCNELIHGDLSPYNVLLAAEGPTIIDFPQVVSAAHNSTAESYFKRDVENLREFFCALDPTLAARTVHDAGEIWHAYVKRDLALDFVPSGRPPPEVRRQERGPRPGGAPPQVRGPHAPQGHQGPQRQQQGKAQQPQQGRAQPAQQQRPQQQHGQGPQGKQGQPRNGSAPHGGQPRQPQPAPPPQQQPPQQRSPPPQPSPQQQQPRAQQSAPQGQRPHREQQHPRGGGQHGQRPHPQGQPQHKGPRPGAPPGGRTLQQGGARPGGPPDGPRHGPPGGRPDGPRSGNRPPRPFVPRGAPAPVVERVVRPPLGQQGGGNGAQGGQPQGPRRGEPRGD